MRFPLWVRLFITFAALSVAGVIVLTLEQRRTFQRDFLAYVNQQATLRVENAAKQLGRRYEQTGDWSFLAGRPRTFDAYIEGRRTAADTPETEPEIRPPRPPDDAPQRSDERLPRQDGARPVSPIDDPPPLRTEDGRLMPRPKFAARIDALSLPSRVALIDDRGQRVIGNPAVPANSPSVPIRVGAEVVGSLLLAPQPALNNDLDVAFVRSQMSHAVMAGVAVTIAALFAAWGLARWLLKPVKTLGVRVEQLAAGDYRARIESGRTDELGELARNYNRLAETLTRNQDARRRWGADIAHELRTPLSILRGEIQAMQDGIRPLSKPALDSLQAECSRLTSLVDDLYQLSLADAGALTYRFETVDFNTLVADVEREYHASLRDAGLALETALSREPLMVRLDTQRMSQLIANLLVNSERYTDAPGVVRLTTSCLGSGSSSRVLLTVDDSAPGVQTELLPKIFDRLFRVEGSRNRAAGGAGLGLS
ncbi:MAG: histidine kinase dimerization/phospho-acceptor domain-containing protein, partial [Burkholderiales bacterium]